MSNLEIQNQAEKMLRNIIKAHVPNQYFVDTESFETLNGMVDYQSVLGKD